MSLGKLCTLFAFMLILLVNGIVHADTSITNLAVSDEVWVNDNSIIRISFNCDVSANVSANISGNGYQKTLANFIESPASYYVLTASLENILENNSPYYVNVFCTKNTTTNQTAIFYVKNLKAAADIIIPSNNPSGVLFPSDTVKFSIELTKNNQIITYDTTFVILLDEKPFEITSINPPTNTISQKWEVEARVPQNFIPVDNKPVNIIATYNTHKVSVFTKEVSVRTPLEVNILEPSLLYPFNVLDAGNINVTVNVKFKGRQLVLYDIIDFGSKLDDRDLTIRKVDYKDPGAWNIVINIPKMPQNKYNLHIYAIYNGYTARAQRPLTIQYIMPFQGILVDADNKPIDAEIIIKGNGIEESMYTKDGRYSLALVSGDYDIYMLLPKARFRFYDVTISYSDELYTTINNVRYDFLDKDIKDIDAVKLIALEFFLPFENVEIVVPYRDSEIDEERIVVYKCNKWFFDKKECKTEWKEINSYVDKNKNFVSFNVSSLSAFALSSRKTLDLELSISKNKYYLGEPVVINGTVEDNEGSYVSNVDVDYSNPDINIFGTATTDSSGAFEISFDAPNKEGTFSLEFTAEKSTYGKDNGKVSFSVYKRTLLTVSGETLSITTGNLSSTKITVSNDGHTTINNINMSIKGIPEQLYKLNKTRINSLEPNEKQEIEMEVSIPEQCNDCKKSYIVDVIAEAEETNAINTFSLFITDISEEQKIQEKESAEDAITGFATFVTTFSFEHLVYILIFVIVIFVFLFYKRKKTIFSLRNFNEKHAVLSRSLHEIKAETFGYGKTEQNKHNEHKQHDTANNSHIYQKNIKTKKRKRLKDIFGSPFE